MACLTPDKIVRIQSNSSKLTKKQRDYQNLLLIVREHREWLAENYPTLVSGAQQAAAAENR